MPLRRGRDKPQRVPMDKEAASAPHALSPQSDPQFTLEFLVTPMPHAKFFPLMTPFTNY